MAFTVGSKEDLFSKLKSMVPAKRLDLFSKTRSQGDSSPFSMLTPTQFAELFPKYYLRQKPDVKGFYDALSQKPMSGEGTYGPHGEAGSSTVSTGAKVTNVVRAKEIYDYIRSKGVDHNHAVGIVNNMKYESGFDSGAMGDHMTSGGLFQHHASRFTAMKNYVGDGWQTNWKKQIDFALTEDEMKTYLAKNFASPVDASREFTLGFERPANKEQQAAARASTAEGYAAAVTGNAGEPGGGATTGGNYEINASGFLVPKNKGLYDPGNEEECATLVKSMNPDVGRSSSWTVLPNASLIRPGVAVATTRYNLEGGDRRGSGYHSGIAMSSPDEQGNFTLLEQSAGRPPRLRQVNAFKYDGGALGGTTQFGVISSNGRIHDEQSMEALNYGAKLAPNDEVRRMIMSNQEAVAKGQLSGSSTGGQASVSVNSDAQPSDAPGPQTNLEQQNAVNNIQTATIGDMMRFVGDLAGFFSRGEGLGGSGHRGHRGHHGHKGHKRHSHDPANALADPELDYTKRSAIEREAKALNVSPKDLTTAMLFESIGSLHPERMGVVDTRPNAKSAVAKGAQKRFMGVIQMGAAEQLKYGVKKGQTFDEHMAAVGRFLKDRDVKKWMDEHPDATAEEKRTALYSAINAGRPEEKHWKKTDKSHGGQPTTVREKSAQMVERYGKRAEQLLTAEAPTLGRGFAQENMKRDMGPPMPESQTATITPEPSFYEKAKTKISDTYEAGKKYLENVIGNQQPTIAKPVQQNVPKGAVDFAPPAQINEEPAMDAPKATNDKHSMNMNQLPPDPAPKPVSFDGLSDGYYKSPSLARAMQNLTDTGGASDGHFGGTSLA